MENDGALGPRPAEGAPARPRGRARAAVLEAVEAGSQRSAAGVTLTGLAEATGLHVNTLRDHLEALLADGLVRRATVPRAGRGRPAWGYRPAPGRSGGSAEYAGLATALATALHRTSPTPVDDAVTAGTDWGRELARTHGAEEPPQRRVVAVLDAMGFAPTTRPDPGDGPGGAAVVRLTRCPLLEAARRYPDVVCGVHLGIARGVLAESGAAGTAASLHPFAEPGACVLTLGDEAAS